MAKYDSIEALEAAARAILKTARADDAAWTPSRAAILNVFHAYPMLSFDAEKILRIIHAVEGAPFTMESIQPQLAKLVREKALRSRIGTGSGRKLRLYEVAV